MRHKKLDAAEIWKQMEDLVVPRLKLTLSEHALYSHLLRHSRLEGTRRIHFSLKWLARGLCVSSNPMRSAVRSLAVKGVLRLIERSKLGHTVEVHLPGEIRACRRKLPTRMPADLETVDFFVGRELRDAIFRRDAHRCFYCFRILTRRLRALDHVVPLAQNGHNGYRNLVAACPECNLRKGERPAEDFFRQLFRERRLNSRELSDRLRALHALTKGKLKPIWKLKPAA